MQEKIVITGMGAISAMGHSVEENWKNITNGMPGAGPITLFDSKEFLVKTVCEVKNFDAEDYLLAREVRRRDRFE